MTESVWDPDQYLRFEKERAQPFFDLASLVRPKAKMRIVDLGCGTGALTRTLHEQLAAAETLGIDSSDSMLAVANAGANAKVNGLRFERGDLAEFRAATPVDLLFSNAAIHWAPDHEALLERLTASVAEGGQLAIQIPANHDHVSQVVAAEIADEPPFQGALGGYVRSSPVLAPEAYAAILDRLGYREQHVRLQVYAHHLASRDDVVEWVKGTLLTDYQKRLPRELFAQFLEAYRARLLPKLADTRPHFYPFKRILFWARK